MPPGLLKTFMFAFCFIAAATVFYEGTLAILFCCYAVILAGFEVDALRLFSDLRKFICSLFFYLFKLK